MEFLVGFLLGLAAGTPSEPAHPVAPLPPEVSLALGLFIIVGVVVAVFSLVRWMKEGV
ncbi:MAG: hypothetical protein I4O36_01990 [Ralstonia pickettii]|mgnify:CR=1 FL=1|jgi:hypothetical protein|uniref:Transmembrane protein n=2 Tax=Ralstonia TaxID=48736 RepID=A0AAD2BUN8_9RALS|nr:hypothetical protein [Ralstonia sp. LMG 18095]MCL6455563.1 hypothetical protein [Ralstonia pickettii]CAJ0802824.1 hypothetical protein R77560_03801 [Ralstonia sp. LMG 18095]CPR56036.1 Uncharacterised protein [Chlamydia trachomatis]